MNLINIITIIILISMQGYSQSSIINQNNKAILSDSTNIIDTISIEKKYDNKKYNTKRFDCKIINLDAPTAIKRGNTYLSQGKYQWAKTFFERAIKIDSSSAQAYLGLAKIARVNKDSVTYRIMLNKAKSININDSEVIYEVNHIWNYNKKNDSK